MAKVDVVIEQKQCFYQVKIDAKPKWEVPLTKDEYGLWEIPQSKGQLTFTFTCDPIEYKKESIRINKEIAEERCSKPNLESIRKKTKQNMNNTAMNFNSSLFDPSHAIPDDHFKDIEQRDDAPDLESRDDDDFERQRSRAPTIVTTNEDMQNKTANLTNLMKSPHQ